MFAVCRIRGHDPCGVEKENLCGNSFMIARCGAPCRRPKPEKCKARDFDSMLVINYYNKHYSAVRHLSTAIKCASTNQAIAIFSWHISFCVLTNLILCSVQHGYPFDLSRPLVMFGHYRLCSRWLQYLMYSTIGLYHTIHLSLHTYCI